MVFFKLVIKVFSSSYRLDGWLVDWLAGCLGCICWKGTRSSLIGFRRTIIPLGP